MSSFKDPDMEVRDLARRTTKVRVREETRLRAEYGYELPEDDRLLVGDTEARRAADRRRLEAAGTLAAVERHAEGAITASPSEWE